MSRLVERGDIVDYQTYNDQRSDVRTSALVAKRLRRIELNDYLTVCFENDETLRYQIQEIMRAERIVKRAEIDAEVGTYNALLGEPGDLGAVLMIHVQDAAERQRRLQEWLGLQEHVFVRSAHDSVVRAQFDPSQVGTDRLSAVQYLRFPVAGTAPVAVGCDFAGLESEVMLTEAQIAALDHDVVTS